MSEITSQAQLKEMFSTVNAKLTSPEANQGVQCLFDLMKSPNLNNLQHIERSELKPGSLLIFSPSKEITDETSMALIIDNVGHDVNDNVVMDGDLIVSPQLQMRLGFDNRLVPSVELHLAITKDSERKVTSKVDLWQPKFFSTVHQLSPEDDHPTRVCLAMEQPMLSRFIPQPAEAIQKYHALLNDIGNEQQRVRQMLVSGHQASDYPGSNNDKVPLRDLLTRLYGGAIPKAGGPHEGLRQNYLMNQNGNMFYASKIDYKPQNVWDLVREAAVMARDAQDYGMHVFWSTQASALVFWAKKYGLKLPPNILEELHKSNLYYSSEQMPPEAMEKRKSLLLLSDARPSFQLAERSMKSTPINKILYAIRSLQKEAKKDYGIRMFSHHLAFARKELLRVKKQLDSNVRTANYESSQIATCSILPVQREAWEFDPDSALHFGQLQVRLLQRLGFLDENLTREVLLSEFPQAGRNDIPDKEQLLDLVNGDRLERVKLDEASDAIVGMKSEKLPGVSAMLTIAHVRDSYSDHTIKDSPGQIRFFFY